MELMCPRHDVDGTAYHLVMRNTEIVQAHYLFFGSVPLLRLDCDVLICKLFIDSNGGNYKRLKNPGFERSIKMEN